MNKRATTLMMRLFNILLIGVLLAGFILIMGLGNLKSGEREEVIKLNEKIGYAEDNLQMINYLRSNFQFPDYGSSSILSILIDYESNKFTTADKEFLKEKTENILNNISYCTIIENNEILKSYSFYLTNKKYESFDMIEEVESFKSEFFDSNFGNIIETQKLLNSKYLILAVSDSSYSGERCLGW